jgi:uncharacterized protein YjbI with pentapeptide repeats
MTPEETVKPKRTRKPKEQANIPCHIHDKCNGDARKSTHKSVCRDLETAKHTDGNYYCLLHLPTEEKDTAKFKQIFNERLHEHDDAIAKIEADFPDDKNAQSNAKREQEMDYDFRYVWFPPKISFRKKTFSGSADFGSATFSGSADFGSATFSGFANFISATFTTGTGFSEATFSNNVYFTKAKFEEESQTFFTQTKFNGEVNFYYANINGFVAFEGINNNRVFVGRKAVLDLQNARIDDAKKLSFHTVRLEPSWFVNVNASEFVFTDCQWRYADGKRLNVKQEIENLSQREASHNPHEILTKVCWQLADNHEESKGLYLASVFRKFANESKRLSRTWYYRPFTLHWWYYAVSFYGESWRRALIVLILVLGSFGLFFESPFASFELTEKKKTEIIATQATDKPEQPQVYKMNYGEGIVYSLSVATFQRPEPKAYGFWTKLFVALEVILAPLQAALLALAIRRKFMR